jgi:hypothetical protein
MRYDLEDKYRFHIDVLQAKLDALKNDAREVAEFANTYISSVDGDESYPPDGLCDSIRRILTETQLLNDSKLRMKIAEESNKTCGCKCCENWSNELKSILAATEEGK